MENRLDNRANDYFNRTELRNADYFNRSQLDLANTKNVLEKQAFKHYDDLKVRGIEQTSRIELQMARVESNLEKEAIRNTASIQLEALRNRADLLSKIDECCCEVKREVAKSGNEVINTVRITDTERLRDRLREVENLNLALEFRRGRGRNIDPI